MQLGLGTGIFGGRGVLYNWKLLDILFAGVLV